MGIGEWIKKLGSNTLYFPGCFAKYKLKEEFDNYKEILNKLDIPFITLEKEVCCGMPAIEAGYKKVARELAQKNYEEFKKNNITKIIAGSPECYYMLKRVYPKLLREWDIEVESIIVTIIKGLRKKRINFKGTEYDKEKIVYHDPTYLSRYERIFDEPREIIERLGGKIIEFKENKEKAMSSGTSGGLYNNYPEIAKKAAATLLSKVPDKEAKIITPSGIDYENMKQINEKATEFSGYIIKKIKKEGL